MALQDIFRALDEQADSECREILGNAKEQAKAIIAEAKEEADRIRTRKVDAAEASVGTKAAQIVNAAKLENKRDIAALKDRAIEKVFEEAKAELGKLRDSSAYESLFRKLSEEALGGRAVAVEVMVDPRDEKLAAKVFADLGADFTVDAGLQTAGGLTAVYENRRIFRRNTLEDRLSKVRQIGQSQVAEILFG